MEIEVTKLLSIIDILKQQIREKLPEIIEVDDDYYWEISKDELFNAVQTPSDLTLGQITFDWQELLSILDDRTPIGHDLRRLAMLLNFIYSNSEGIW